jgi:antitoxin VapB
MNHVDPVGDELRIRPACRPIRGALQALASFAPGVMAKGRGDQEQGDREGFTEG